MGIRRRFKKNKIGVIAIHGAIRGGRQTAEIIHYLRIFRENPKIKSVILNVDSPGGLVTASDNLYMATSRLSETKPTIAYISGTGASGAYLLACAATKIVALPGSAIGSIGVLSEKFLIYEFLDRRGIRLNTAKSGHLKDMGSMFRDPTEEEETKEQELLDSFHTYFIQAVAKGRHLEESRVRELATGEVFLGQQGKPLGLVDELGDFETALDIASDLGNVPRTRVVYATRRRTFLQRAFSRFGSSIADQLISEAQYAMERHFYFMDTPDRWRRF
ncbi:MAG: signal peptide peptidase SppA [Chloroflexota bacterium]|nr:signal peptide peptidase SppA [Chloroflexota bacterium]